MSENNIFKYDGLTGEFQPTDSSDADTIGALVNEQSIVHETVNAATFGFKFASPTGVDNIAYPKCYYNVWATERGDEGQLLNEGYNYWGVSGPYVQFCCFSEVDRQLDDYIKFNCTYNENDDQIDIDLNFYASAMSATGSYVEYASFDFSTGLGIGSKTGVSARYMTNCFTPEYSNYFFNFPLFGSEQSRYKIGVDSTSSFDFGYDLMTSGEASGYYIGLSGGTNELTKFDYQPPEFIQTLVSAKNLKCSNTRNFIMGHNPSASDIFDGVSNLYGNFGCAVKDDTNFNWSTFHGNVFHASGTAPYLYFINERSSYYVEASATIDKNPGSNSDCVTASAYFPSYRFAYNYSSLDGGFGANVSYDGMKPVHIDDDGIDPSIKKKIEKLESDNAIAATYDFSGNPVLDEIRRSWPIASSDGYQLSNEGNSIFGPYTFLVVDNDGIKDLSGDVGKFVSGSIYGYDSTEVNGKVQTTELFRYVPGIVRGDGYGGMFNMEVNHNATSANEDGTINRQLYNLAAIEKFDFVELETKETNYNSTIYDEVVYEIDWKIDDLYVIASLGTLILKILHDPGRISLYYDGADDPSYVTNTGSDYEIKVVSEGRKLIKVGILYEKGTLGTSLTFNAMSCQSYYKSFFEKYPSACFGDSFVSGCGFYFPGKMFDRINIDLCDSSSGTEIKSGGTYNFCDSVDWDAKVSPDVDTSNFETIGIPSDTPITMPRGMNSGWYLYINTEDYLVDSSIHIEILDCKGHFVDGNNKDKWVDYPIKDVTDNLYGSRPNGLDSISDVSDGVDVIFNTTTIAVDRIKVRFRLVADRVGAKMLVTNAGYQVCLGYRIEDYDGSHRDFAIHSANYNPILPELKTEIKTYLSNKRDYDKFEYGCVYASASATPTDMMCVSGGSEITGEQKYMWNINQKEETSAVASFGDMYYYAQIWDSSGTVPALNLQYGIYFRKGSYLKVKNDFNLDFGTDGQLDLGDKFEWDGINKIYKRSSSYTGPSFSADDSSTIKPMSIYDLKSSEIDPNNSVMIKRSDDQIDYYYLKNEIGGDWVKCFSSGTTSEISLSERDFVIGSNSTEAPKVDLYFGDGSVLSDSNDIPILYYLASAVDGVVTESRNVYPKYRLVEIEHQPLKTPDLSFSNFSVTPASADDKFYIVNGRKRFGVYLNATLETTADGENKIELDNYTLSWNVSAYEGDNEVWRTPSGESYSVSKGNTIAAIPLYASDSNDIGTIRYGVTNGKLNFSVDCVCGLKIYVGGQCVGSVESSKLGHGDDWSINEIKCPYLPYWTPNSYVLNRESSINFRNNTERSSETYDKYDIILNELDRVITVPGSSEYASTTADMYRTDYTNVNIRGYLTDAWKDNDEGLQMIAGREIPAILIVDGMEYDDTIKRVMNGTTLKYPHDRNEILFAPNEWFVADTLNERFVKLLENLEYYVEQTKFYLPSPTKFCGYFGDYKTPYKSGAGYVSVTNETIYELCDENQSLDGESMRFGGCDSICVASVVQTSAAVFGDDFRNNMYCCFGDMILITEFLPNINESFGTSTIDPKKINEFLDEIVMMHYSFDRNLLYCLSKKTHRIYLFDKQNDGSDANLGYYGEFGGYGGLIAKFKFNRPNDFYISTVFKKDGESYVKDKEEMWVCDSGNHAVKHYTINGGWISTFDLTDIEDELIGLTVDRDQRVYVMTNEHIYKYDVAGNRIGDFDLGLDNGVPLVIRSQYKSDFIYILYPHCVVKYDEDGNFLGKFAVNSELTYTSMCVSENHDVYVATNKNILHYCDTLRMGRIGAMDNTDDFRWKYEDIAINKNENVQDMTLNTALQRMYDNIMMYAICTFGNTYNDKNGDIEISDRKKLFDAFHKERIFVGINELVTVNVINRSLSQMCDLMDLMLDSIR